MKRLLLTICLLAIIVCCGITSALADVNIITPQEGETLPVENGMIHVKWDMRGESGFWMIMDESYNYVLDGDIAAGEKQAYIRVSGVLAENTTYIFGLASDAEEAMFATFHVSYQGTSDGADASQPDVSTGTNGQAAANEPIIPLVNSASLDDEGKYLVEAYNNFIEKIFDTGLLRGKLTVD